MAVNKLNPASGGIPYGVSSGRPTASLGKLYSNGETARLEIYTNTGWQNIVQETPGVASVTGYYYESDNSGTFTVYGTNFVDGATAYAIGTNGIAYEALSTTYNSLVQLVAVFSNLSALYEPYDIKITNPSNLFGILPEAFYINESPLWGTTAGSLGTFNQGSVSVQLSSSDAESNSLTYSLVSGSLPTGLTLSSSGLISGTNSGSSNTTYTFTVSVSDGYNSSVTRTFSMYVPYATLSGGTLSSDSTYYYRTFTGNGNLVISGSNTSVDILAIAGGGAGGSAYHGAGGGAGGVVYLSSQNLSIGSKEITVGAGGASPTNGLPGERGGNGFPSQFTSLTQAIGGGGGNSYGNASQTKANSGGSGGGGAQNQTAGATNHLGGDGTFGQGNNGGNARSNDSWIGGAGGGGAGSVGGNGYGDGGQAGSLAGAGGSGTNTYASWLSAISSQMTGISGWSTATSGGYIAGGGSGSYGFGGTSAQGGAGGGGTGSYAQGGDGVLNTGSGGGGAERGQSGGTGYRGGNGGSGVVIVRYTKASVGG